MSEDSHQLSRIENKLDKIDERTDAVVVAIATLQSNQSSERESLEKLEKVVDALAKTVTEHDAIVRRVPGMDRKLGEVTKNMWMMMGSLAVLSVLGSFLLNQLIP